VFRRMLMPSPLDRLPTPGNRRYHHAKVRLRQSLTEIITARNANTTHHRDLLGALLSARDPEGNNQGLSETEILDQVVTFFLAGTETTASTPGRGAAPAGPAPRHPCPAAHRARHRPGRPPRHPRRPAAAEAHQPSNPRDPPPVAPRMDVHPHRHR
jgi:hypothetical protein